MKFDCIQAGTLTPFAFKALDVEQAVRRQHCGRQLTSEPCPRRCTREQCQTAVWRWSANPQRSRSLCAPEVVKQRCWCFVDVSMHGDMLHHCVVITAVVLRGDAPRMHVRAEVRKDWCMVPVQTVRSSTYIGARARSR